MCWDDVYKTKNEEGLGIRRIDEVAKAVAIKLLWNYITGDTLWEKWMQNKYCKSANFQTVTMDNNASYTWKTLLRARKWCKGYIDRKIINGDITYIWFDPWLNGSSLIDMFGWNSMVVNSGCNKQVSKLISGNVRKPHLQQISTQIHTAVHKLIIHNHIEHDFWFWIPNKLGHFSMKSAGEQDVNTLNSIGLKLSGIRIVLQKCLFVHFWQK